MKKWMIAGAGMVFLLGLGGKAYGAGAYSHHEGCGRYVAAFVGLESRHNCLRMEEDDVSCYDVIWHYGQHYNGDGSLYCPEHDCVYDDCYEEHNAEYCGGGGCRGNGSFRDRNRDSGSNAGSESEGSGDSGWGNYSSGHHGSGHHGRGHH